MTRLARWGTGAVLGAVFALVVDLLGNIVGSHSRPWLAAVVGATAGALVLAVAELWSAATGDPPGEVTPVADLADRAGAGLLFAQRQLERAAEDADRADQVRDRLRAVAVDRLRHGHGLDAAGDLDAVADLVDDAVWALLREPGGRTADRATVADWVRGLEKL